MKIKHLIFALMMLLTGQALSNNVQVSNVRLTAQNTTDDFTMVEFDITWENSWRYSGGPANWDAAWIFVKYRVSSSGQWQHAWLNNTGHSACGNGTITNGFLSPELPYNSGTNPSLGVFLYRSAPGSGSFTCQDVQLRWNYGSNSVSDNAQVDIKVFAIEMVYIPQGSFYVGSGGSENGAFYTYPETTTPYLINSEAPITIGTTTGNLFYNFVQNGYAGDQAGLIPIAFPKGFNAYYAMKYEISQQAYVDFLNTLSRSQQASRVRTNISGTTPGNLYVLADWPGPNWRNGITCNATIPAVPAPVEFFCDYNGNRIMNEISDGQCIAVNYINHNDVAAYLDWASLRLMTEFEFEKCGRGTAIPSANEYAWGNQIIYLHEANPVNAGQPTESSANPISNTPGIYNYGPLRTGIFATTSSNRTASGSGYHGCQEITGNLNESGVSVGSANGRNYQGTHGNGILTINGNADVATWPLGDPLDGAFKRGGSWGEGFHQKRISDRYYATFNHPYASNYYGGRGVRTAQ